MRAANERYSARIIWPLEIRHISTETKIMNENILLNYFPLMVCGFKEKKLLYLK